MDSIDFAKIKLVIWDLDDTFWKGTLSEGVVISIDDNINLVKSLTDHGVINSICSKNDEAPACERLSEMAVADYFVFKSINWQPKGQRISQLIKDMGLRPMNCLFIDDNPVNLNEAKYYEPSLLVAEPSILPKLTEYFERTAITDISHKRLKQYQILEQKQIARGLASDNEAFLYDSDTHVAMHDNCLDELDRIHELVNRTNQLNFTKVRSNREELVLLLKDPSVKSGYVTVSDRFGDYGIVGFYAIKSNVCIHFLFSCRTIGQGVEQFVYAQLGYPQLTVVGEVVNNVTKATAPEWINQSKASSGERQHFDNTTKIVIKGGCDLKSMSSYLGTRNIIEEFTYVGNRRCNWIENQNHSTNYLSFPFLDQKKRQLILDECIFADEMMFDTAMYDEDVALVFLSTMSEPNLGIYRHKNTGIEIAWGEYKYPLTNPNNWDGYLKGTLFNADNNFTTEWLKKFSSNWEFLGRLAPEQILENIKCVLSRISPKAKLCLMLGSETPFLRNDKPNYENRHMEYKAINSLIRDFAASNERIILIDFNNYIHGQDDFTNNINHFVRRVYYEAATEANKYISEITGQRLNQRSRFFLGWKSLADRLAKTGFFNTRFYRLIRLPYQWIYRRLVTDL